MATGTADNLRRAARMAQQAVYTTGVELEYVPAAQLEDGIMRLYELCMAYWALLENYRQAMHMRVVTSPESAEVAGAALERAVRMGVSARLQARLQEWAVKTRHVPEAFGFYFHGLNEQLIMEGDPDEFERMAAFRPTLLPPVVAAQPQRYLELALRAQMLRGRIMDAALVPTASVNPITQIYRVSRKLGRGATGSAYSVRRNHLSYVVKIDLFNDATRQEIAVHRLLEEARTRQPELLEAAVRMYDFVVTRGVLDGWPEWAGAAADKLTDTTYQDRVMIVMERLGTLLGDQFWQVLDAPTNDALTVRRYVLSILAQLVSFLQCATMIFGEFQHRDEHLGNLYVEPVAGPEIVCVFPYLVDEATEQASTLRLSLPADWTGNHALRIADFGRALVRYRYAEADGSVHAGELANTNTRWEARYGRELMIFADSVLWYLTEYSNLPPDAATPHIPRRPVDHVLAGMASRVRSFARAREAAGQRGGWLIDYLRTEGNVLVPGFAYDYELNAASQLRVEHVDVIPWPPHIFARP
jgi:hypothetical protein